MSFEKWETVELNQIAKTFDCPHSTPNWTDSGVFVIRSWNVRGGRLNFDKSSYTDEKTYLERTRRAKLEFGDLVLTREAPMGEVCMVPENLKCCLGQRVVLIKPNREKVDSHFLLYSFQSAFVQNQIMASEGTGSTVSNLRIPLIETLKIPLPPLATQRRIAALLTALDDKIELNRRMNETLESIAGAVWGEWFGRYAGGEELPEGWRFQNCHEVLKVQYGKNLPTTKLTDSGFPVFGGNGQIGYYSEYLFESTQVILACRGAASGTFNQSLPKSFVTNNSLIFEIPEGSPLKFGFLKQFCNQSDMSSFVSGSAQPQVTIESLRKFEILIPTENMINQFESIANPIETQILENNHQSRTLTALRDALLPRLMSGGLEI